MSCFCQKRLFADVMSSRRLLNLELLLQFGSRAWQAHIRHLEVAQQGYAALYLSEPLVTITVLSKWRHITSRLD